MLDEGPGIPPGEEKQVFERFRRGRSDRPGTGLGLAIVETLARRWGGTASIRNRETGGARAEVRLPVDRSARDLEQVTLMRTAALGLLGLLLAVAVGYGVHLITRETISLPVVQLEQPAPARSACRDERRTHDDRQTTTAKTDDHGTTTEDRGTQTDDNSGSGSSGKGRGRGPRRWWRRRLRHSIHRLWRRTPSARSGGSSCGRRSRSLRTTATTPAGSRTSRGEAGVAYGLVYHYFGSKEELLETIFRRTWSRMLEAVQEVERSGIPAREQLQAVARIVLGAWETDPDLVRVLVREVARSPQLGNEVEEVEHAFAALERIIVHGQEQGELKPDLDPRFAALIVYGALEEILTGWVFGRLPAEPGRRRAGRGDSRLSSHARPRGGLTRQSIRLIHQSIRKVIKSGLANRKATVGISRLSFHSTELESCMRARLLLFGLVLG